jgi:hypothetical protein
MEEITCYAIKSMGGGGVKYFLKTTCITKKSFTTYFN